MHSTALSPANIPVQAFLEIFVEKVNLRPAAFNLGWSWRNSIRARVPPSLPRWWRPAYADFGSASRDCLRSGRSPPRPFNMCNNHGKEFKLFIWPQIFCPFEVQSHFLVMRDNWWLHRQENLSFLILLTHEGSHREVYQDFQPSLTSSASSTRLSPWAYAGGR